MAVNEFFSIYILLTMSTEVITQEGRGSGNVFVHNYMYKTK